MSNVLTDEDIELAMQGNSLPMDHDELKEFATAIELAVLAKAGEQEPVAWLHDDPKRIDVIHDEVKKLVEASYAKYGFESGVQRSSVNRVEHYTVPLYSHPAPQQAIPEVPTKEMVIAGINASMDGAPNLNDWDYIVKIYKAMLSASQKV